MRRGRHLDIALAALALWVRLLIPVGYMPAPSQGQGLYQVTLCTASGMATAWIDAEGKPTKAPTDKAHDPCPYGALGAVAMPDPPRTFSDRRQFVLPPVPAPSPLLRPGMGLAAPPPPATGPPAQA